MSEDAPRILALDFGLARVGLALSYGTLAEPLIILANDDSLFEKILSVCHQHGVEKIVVGQSEQEMAEKSKSFADLVHQTTQLPVEMFDETLSSAEVHRKLAQRDSGKRHYKGAIDHMAAAHFLQQYLDEHYS
jgi:putative transcription antitermination factor YqgF